MHSFKQFSDLIEFVFHHFDPKPLNKKMLKQWKASHESPMDFWNHFHLLMFEVLKGHIKFQYLMDRFEYCCHKSTCPKVKKNFNPTQHTSVMGLCNLKKTLSLSQVIVHLPLIKQLHPHRVMWESVHTCLFSWYMLPPPLLLISTNIWLGRPWVVICTYYLNLRLHILLIL